ncbi:MAG: GNAT family N-acetyltransferase [Spirochaetaceae bacterium]|nr:GNAT family N-acetyltransferase [Spirochaetaceae bacterium]
MEKIFGKKLVIRVMTPADYAPALALWRMVSGVQLRGEDDTEAGIRKFLDRNPRTCFIAELDGTAAGVLLSGHDGRRGFIYHTAVRPEYQRRGLGGFLTAAAENALRAEGIRKVALVAFKANAEGNQFWEKAGFSVREDLVYRNKSLSGSAEQIITGVF